MRIAIIPAIFDHDLNYQENVCARVFSEMGHDVRVFTSWHGVENREATQLADQQSAIRVWRVNKILTIRKTVIPYDAGIAKMIGDFNPEIAFVMAPLHGLGYFWMKHLPPQCRLIPWFSDIPFHREGSALRSWIKARWARQVFKRSQMIIASTPETATLLTEWGGDTILPKLKSLGLTFEPRMLAPKTPLPSLVSDWVRRYPTRLAVITKVIPHKELHLFFPHIEEFLRANPDVGLIIAGLTENESSQQLARVVESSAVRAQVLLHPALDSHQIGAVLRLSNLTIWNSVSIGIYHSLACGCPTLNWTGKGYAHHLVRDGENGFWYQDWADLPVTLEKALAHPWDKERIKASVSFADATQSLPQLLAEVMSKNA